MTELRSQRVAVSLTQREHTALQAMAQRQRVPVSKLIAQMARSQLALEHADPPAHPETLATAEPDPPSVVGAGPIWLPPVAKSALAEWARSRAAAVQALIDRYPAELSALDDGWAKDAAVREQLWALTVWRDQLDTGTHRDPRIELTFAGALRDFATYLRERPRASAHRRR